MTQPSAPTALNPTKAPTPTGTAPAAKPASSPVARLLKDFVRQLEAEATALYRRRFPALATAAQAAATKLGIDFATGAILTSAGAAAHVAAAVTPAPVTTAAPAPAPAPAAAAPAPLPTPAPVATAAAPVATKGASS